MAISGVSSGSASALYQWQNQRLNSSLSGTSGASASKSRSSSALGSYGNLSDQLSSMVELTKYAMDAMGLSSDSRVTFGQIAKYREQLNTEFNTGVKEGLSGLGVGDPTALAFTLDAQGVLTAAGPDAANAQQWLDANPQWGAGLRAALTQAGVDKETPVTMTLDAAGRLSASGEDAAQAAVQAVLDASSVGKAVYGGLNSLSSLDRANFSLSLDEGGALVVDSSDAATKAAVQRFFDSNPQLVKKFKQIEALSGLDDARRAMRISPTEMRRRIEVESLAAWWADSGSSGTGTFGTFGESGLSLLSGLNLSV